MLNMIGKVYQINQKPKTIGEVGLPKIKVDNTMITLSGIKGDYNNFRKIKKNNDPNMSILILCMDVIDELNKEGWPVKPGDLGENITITGINYDDLAPKQKYYIDSALIEITLICDPCSSLKVLPYIGNKRINDFIKTMMNRRGWYAKVLKVGKIKQGSLITPV